MATYAEIDALRQNQLFRGRIAVAIIKYAATILGESAATPFHESRAQWARRAMSSPEEQVSRLLGYLVAPIQEQTDINAITDAVIQGAVTDAVNSYFQML